MSSGYTVSTVADAALSAATAKTVVNAINSASNVLRCVEFGVSFDGVAAAAEPVLVELMSSTQATAGTPGSSPTPLQVRGVARAALFTAGEDYSAEPTVLTRMKHWLVHPQTGIVIQFPLGREPEQPTTADGLCIRCTAPATVNCAAYMECEEG